MPGIDTLRNAVRAFADCDETFLHRFEVSDLLALYEGFRAIQYLILPDKWSERQIQEWLQDDLLPQWGDAQWDESETPIYAMTTISIDECLYCRKPVRSHHRDGAPYDPQFCGEGCAVLYIQSLGPK